MKFGPKRRTEWFYIQNRNRERKEVIEMVVLYCKIGTGPATHVRIKHKRSIPEVGEKFQARECNQIGLMNHGEKWQDFRITDAKGPNEIFPQKIYYLERF